MSHTVLGPLAFWEGYEGELLTLAAYGVGLALYALLVGTFYNTLSHRNLLPRVKSRKNFGALTYLVLFPIVSFGFFMVLGIALFFLAKGADGVTEGIRVPQLLLLSMAIVAGVRVAAYVSEGAAADLGKLLPLGLLGVLLVDPGYYVLSTPFERLGLLPSVVDLIWRYFVALIILEVVLRALWTLTGGPARAARGTDRTSGSPAPADSR